LMGDPDVAKSELLKHIIDVAPRGVYYHWTWEQWCWSYCYCLETSNYKWIFPRGWSICRPTCLCFHKCRVLHKCIWSFLFSPDYNCWEYADLSFLKKITCLAGKHSILFFWRVITVAQ
jgi:hypothetical protein